MTDSETRVEESSEAAEAASESTDADAASASTEPAGDDAEPDHRNVPVVTATEAEAEPDPLAEAEAERDGYLDDLRRLSAEFANFRKQIDKRSADVRATAAADLVEKLLPALDACDAAIRQGADDVVPIRSALVDTLTKEGLEVLDPEGEPFDPEHHEAVMTEEGDGDPVVAEVLRTGYAWNGRIVRPAMVKVRG